MYACTIGPNDKMQLYKKKASNSQMTECLGRKNCEIASSISVRFELP